MERDILPKGVDRGDIGSTYTICWANHATYSPFYTNDFSTVKKLFVKALRRGLACHVFIRRKDNHKTYYSLNW